jgi:hypothetical protein
MVGHRFKLSRFVSGFQNSCSFKRLNLQDFRAVLCRLKSVSELSFQISTGNADRENAQIENALLLSRKNKLETRATAETPMHNPYHIKTLKACG